MVTPTKNTGKALIVHRVENHVVQQSQEDGYVHATALCKAAGKQFGHYHENKTTKDFLKAISLDIGIPISKLISTFRGRPAHLQGTWVHPRVAIHLAQWLSTEFAVQVTKWVLEWSEIQSRITHYVAQTKREWEKVFPDDLWRQFSRLTGHKGSIHNRPQWWGHLVNHLVYDLIDPTMAAYLRATKPPPRKGQNYHQYLTENGLMELNNHLQRVIGIAMTCQTMGELRETLERIYGDQFSLELVIEKVPEMLWEGEAVY